MTPELTPLPQKYDALLVLSFGGPEGMDDVIPFLENVLRGRNVPRQRMLAVAEHYKNFGGVSPLNQQNRNLIAALQAEFESCGLQLPIYFGNRNWHPLLPNILRQMAADGIKNALAFFTSAYSSYSSCRQYLEDITRARSEVGPDTPQIYKLRAFYNHPGFIEPNIQNVQAALKQIPAKRQAVTHIAFTAHSIPAGMAQNSSYEAQLQEVAQLVAAGIGNTNWKLVYQSRSGPPRQPWLEPNICDHLESLKAKGVADVVIAPVGFISDHMEIVFDLDNEARDLADSLNLNLVRAATVGTHPTFIKMIRQLVEERLTPSPKRLYLGTLGPSPDVCADTCCLAR